MSLADKGDSNYSVALRKSIFFQYSSLCISCEDDTVWVWNERSNISITSAVIIYRGAGWTGELWWCYTPTKIQVQACLQRVDRSVALFALRWQTLQHQSRARQTLSVIFGRGLSVWGASTRSDLHKCLLTLQPKLSRLFIFSLGWQLLSDQQEKQSVARSQIFQFTHVGPQKVSGQDTTWLDRLDRSISPRYQSKPKGRYWKACWNK